MYMSNEDITKEYREAKNKKEQIKILADLNVCDKKDIEKIIEYNQGGIIRSDSICTEVIIPVQPEAIIPVAAVSEIMKEALSQKKKIKNKIKEPVAPVQPEVIIPMAAVPEIVKEALSQKMIELQETIDMLRSKQKESEQQMETLYKYLRKCI